jgi:two-component system NtrC family response regulator
MQNRIKRAVIMADNRHISREDLGLPQGVEASPMALNLREVRQAAESSAITRALSLSDGNLSNAAKLLGVTRPTLYDLMGRYGMVVQGE